MDITVSIDDQMFQKAYLFAKSVNKTVEQLIYEYFKQFESEADKEISEFRRLTAEGQGRSKGWRFDREEFYAGSQLS